MPSSLTDAATPSPMLHALDRALDQSHEVKAKVEARAADLRSANEVAKARISDGATTLPAAEALQDGLAAELEVQGWADDLQRVTAYLARGLEEVRAVEQALKRSSAALAKSQAALTRSRTAGHAVSQLAMQDLKTGAHDATLSADRPVRAIAGPERQGATRDTGCAVDDAGSNAVPTPPHVAHSSGAVIKVLVAEDDSFMRDLVHRVLAGGGMQVTSYGSAADLLSEGNLASATVLLLDVKMPGMSGLDLQDLLRRRGVELPVVFISGNADLALAVTAMRNGAADFIEKPFQGAFLIERVRRAVARHADRMARSDRLVVDPQVLPRFETLTPREREVFDLLVKGMSSKLIARELGGSFRTIEIHRAQVMHKMAARHLSELVRMSIESIPPHGVHVR